MKKTLLLILALTAGIANAQEQHLPQIQKKERLSPQQRASIKSKKMTLALDLSEQQQVDVYSILLAEAKSQTKEPITRKQGAQLDPEQRYQRMQSKLDAQIRVKRQLKNVLRADQYEKMEQMMQKRKQQMKRKIRARKKRRQ